MAAPTVYHDIAEDVTLDGRLFAGKKFWVAQRVPSRTRYVDLIKSNGGEVVMLEKKADYMINDHYRTGCPPGSISYEFIDKSIDRGELQDPDDHRAGPRLGEAREPGSINRPARDRRAPYTAEEDRILYQWVRNAEAAGSRSGGNEIYKQLEKEYPRHTWQSWRDRYLKRLRNRPPSTFDIPKVAPPSPPSEQAAEKTRPVEPSSKQVKPSISKKPDGSATKKVSGQGKSMAKEDYSLGQLEATFSSEDWEKLYAFVEVIDKTKGKESYEKAWVQWAEYQDNQTAEQWRQYYEKVVRPQWLRDPVSKREEIKKRVEEKYPGQSQDEDQDENQDSQEDEATEASTPKPSKVSDKTDALNSNNFKMKGTEVGHETSKDPQDQSSAQHKDETTPTRRREITISEDERLEQLLEAHKADSVTTAYTFFAQEKKQSMWNENRSFDHTELHEHLLIQWNSLTEKERAPYIAKEKSDVKPPAQQVSALSTEENLLSSSTALNESPRHLKELYTKTLKRIREEDVLVEPEEQEKEPRPIKRLKHAKPSSASESVLGQTHFAGTIDQPLEISSGAVSFAGSQDGDTTLRPEEQTIEHVLQAKFEDEQVLELDLDQATNSIETDDFKDIDYIDLPLGEDEDEDEESDLPSNTPTPRATRRKTKSSDTQAILSSPSQSIPITALPRPRYTRDSSSASPDIPITALPRPFPSPRNAISRASSETSNPIDPPSSIHEPESEASTTQSLQEFRSFHSDDTKLAPIAPLPRPRRVSPSPTPSSASSLDSDSDEGDPDVPLTADEMNLFFDEQRTDDITDDFISRALMRTRCRPGLAIEVLDAWRKGEPLPGKRGIWSKEDDEAVESGDGRALNALERKHTLDGWGGITERLVFLEACRGK